MNHVRFAELVGYTVFFSLVRALCIWFEVVWIEAEEQLGHIPSHQKNVLWPLVQKLIADILSRASGAQLVVPY